MVFSDYSAHKGSSKSNSPDSVLEHRTPPTIRPATGESQAQTQSDTFLLSLPPNGVSCGDTSGITTGHSYNQDPSISLNHITPQSSTFMPLPFPFSNTTFLDNPTPFPLAHLNSPCPPGPDQSIGINNWPLDLPPPEILLHLIDTLFLCNPLFTRLVHRPSFMPNLLLNPNDPRFPSVAFLHAICALGSLYSSDLAQRFQRTTQGSSVDVRAFGYSYPAYNPFSYGEELKNLDNFSEEQASMARALSQMDVGLGRRMLECVQCTILLGWYYVSFSCSVHTAQILIPLFCAFSTPLLSK